MRWLALLLLTTAPLLAADPPKREIVRTNADAMKALLADDAVIEELGGEGYKWTEGPVWDKKAKRLLFSDIPNNRIVEWSEAGKFKDFLKPAGYTGAKDFGGKEPGSNGLAFDKDGSLLICQHGDRRIARLKDGKLTTVTDGFADTNAKDQSKKRYNSPNDLVVHSSGRIYFTDPPYGLPGGVKDPEKELDYQGVFMDIPGYKSILLTREMTRPNGIALSPDEKTLYVANSDSEKAVWMKFALTASGIISGKGEVFADATKQVGKEMPGLPDGMKVDAQGNLWATGPGGVWIFNAKGENVGLLKTNVPTANVGWGDDGGTLYITANDKLLRIRTKVKGPGF